MNNYLHNRPNFQNEIIIDPERNIALNARTLNAEQDIRYYRSSFTSYRPDLTEPELEQFYTRLYVGERFLNALHYKLLAEMRRVFLQYPPGSVNEKILHFNDQFYQLAQPFTLGQRAHVNRSWQDATKIVNYFEIALQKIAKYGNFLQIQYKGLNYPHTYVPYSKEELQKQEDDITNRFIKEMRKPPQ
ncbi:hypothetical protein pb186bvf_004338 [Paramecium bursaria]